MIAAFALLAALATPGDSVPVSLLTGPESACTVAGWQQGQHRQPREVRLQNLARVDAMAVRVGAARDVRKVLATIALRESTGMACAVHTLGRGEFGLGMHGLNVYFHLPRWDPSVPARGEGRRVLFVPEVSTLATLRLFHRAVTGYGAQTWLEVHQVFATGSLRARPDKDARWCRRLRGIGLSCRAKPGRLGGRLIGSRVGQVEAVREVQVSVLGEIGTI